MNSISLSCLSARCIVYVECEIGLMLDLFAANA